MTPICENAERLHALGRFTLAMKRKESPMSEAQDHVEGREKRVKPTAMPAEGPHAEKHLTDEDKTPGTGSLVDKNMRHVQADVGPD
jgi:hypothetical protein